MKLQAINDFNAQNEVTETQLSNDSIDNDTDDEWREATERPSGNMNTLLHIIILTSLNFAPREGNRPLGIFMDKDSEFLSFPAIYCGKLVPVHYPEPTARSAVPGVTWGEGY